MIKLGWKAGAEQYPPQELLNYAVAADAAGFDCLDVSDHFHPWSEEGQASFAWTWLGAAAVQTKRIELGPGVTCPTLRYDPAVIAQAAATLACFAPNRAYLAVGTGEALNEYAATGFWPGYAERRARMIEAIDLIRRLWRGQDVTFDGEYYQTRKARLFTHPQGAIPLYVSALVPESAFTAGAFGDGLMTTGGEKPEHYRELLQQFEAGAREAGKDPAQMPRLVELNVAYTDDEQGAIEPMQRYWAGTFIPALFNERIYTPKDSAKNGNVVQADAIRKSMCLSNRAEDHTAFAQQYLDLGFTTLIYHSAGPDQHDFIERYGREVLPKIRERNGGAVQRRVA
jgi:coenzyme F420-dependent glucose-6-phosphate dehydrogenase